MVEEAEELEVQPGPSQSQHPGEEPGGSISASSSPKPAQPVRAEDQLNHRVHKPRGTGLLSLTPKPPCPGPHSHALSGQVSAGSPRPSCLPIPAVQKGGPKIWDRKEGTPSHWPSYYLLHQSRHLKIHSCITTRLLPFLEIWWFLVSWQFAVQFANKQTSFIRKYVYALHKLLLCSLLSTIF